ncbi:MAG TPA: T9SS type A sorting domain-containing protein [Bacteroidales bacterium]|nr:T9SS type A sorting domain-containing protein [Bacteroidales bacterium]
MKKIITLVFVVAITINSGYSQWNQQILPSPKGQLQSAKMGDLLYFIGGCDSNFNIVSTVDVYNSFSGTWLPSTNISSPRCFTASVGGDSALYVAGGVSSWSNAVGSTVIDIYKNGVWSSLTLPDSSCFGQALHVGNKILLAGHLKRFNAGTSTLVPSDLVFVYDEVTKSMSVDTLSQARTFVAAATDGIIGIFAGGSQGYNMSSDVVDIYNSITDTWSTATLSQARTNFSGVYAGGKFFFAGGAGPGTNLSYNTVDIYDGTNWSTAQLSAARAGIATCTAGNKVFFAGGGNVNSMQLLYTTASSVVDIYDISQESWSTSNMNFTKVTHTAIGAGNKIFVAGGLSGSSVLDAFEIYDAGTGISESSGSGVLKLFPNPSSGEIQLQLPSEFIGSEFYINDLAGRIILSGKVQNSCTGINISDLVDGLYFLNIPGNKLPAIKLIKQ